MSKVFLIIAAFLGAVSVTLGAFGAHALKKIASPEMVVSFETGVRYQFYHTFALLIIGLLLERMHSQLFVMAGWSFVIGIALFSGSLYLMTALNVTGKVGIGGLGIITPIGGLLFIVGWVLMLIGFIKR